MQNHSGGDSGTVYLQPHPTHLWGDNLKTKVPDSYLSERNSALTELTLL